MARFVELHVSDCVIIQMNRILPRVVLITYYSAFVFPNLDMPCYT